ncbi:MAG: glycerol acyltransferase, partial [Mycolicibacterium hassiacum]
FRSRGTWLAERLGPIARLARTKIVPISFGFPFGLSLVVPPNLPLPAKITMRVLPPIDIEAEFGADPDIDEVDAHVRRVMQRALDELAAERRLPVLG